jgi:hypothetical protein
MRVGVIITPRRNSAGFISGWVPDVDVDGRLTQSQFEEMPIAVPFALAWRGRISGTYTLGIVNFV